MRLSLWGLFILACLLTPRLGLGAGGLHADPTPVTQSLGDYFEPGQSEEENPLAIRQIMGLVIAGLSSIVILLFVFSFLMGSGERIREKMSEASDPFFTIVAILLVLLFLATVQTYYSEIFDWLRTFASSV